MTFKEIGEIQNFSWLKTKFVVQFTAGEWINETGVLESKVGGFYNVRPDKNKSILLALKEEEFEIV